MGFFSNIRNKGTMIIPPPRPLNETTQPAMIPTKMGKTGDVLASLTWVSVDFAAVFPHIMLAILSIRKPKNTV